MSKPVVVLDACVLIPMPLCDTLLRAAEKGLYRFHTSDKILEETKRNLAKILERNRGMNPTLAEEKAQKKFKLLKKPFQKL